MDDKTGGTMTLGRPPAAEVHALRITVTEGPDRGAHAVVDGRTVLIGRAEGVGMRLTDPAVSSIHVELSASAGGIEVRDLSSHNGTFFAGARLTSAVVPPGAVLEVGASSLRVELDARVAPAEQELASFGKLRGASSVMRAVFALLARLAPTELSLLVEGPTGTGKELAARAVHEASRSREGPFVVLDCATIPKALAESVLFGHECGALPGTSEARSGVFEEAEGGTVFLDEVGELASDLQPKLLRVIERREVTRVGGTKARPVRIRIVVSTWRDLREMVNTGAFREDLYFRLAEARVVLPPLRERTEDIPALVYHFLQSLPADMEAARTIAREALDELKRREYRGNVRELRSTVERVALLAKGPIITASDLAFERLMSSERQRASPVEPTDIAPFKEAKRTLLDEFEHDYLKVLLARAGENLSRASALSGVERHHLRDLLRKYGLRDK